MNYRKYLEAAGVPAHLHDEAVAYLEASEDRYHEARIPRHKLTAWAVVGWLLLTGKVRYEDNALPVEYRAYDNEVSMNGDRGTWVWTDDGYAMLQPCPLDDTALQWSYFPPHHPRSKWHRWMWLGFRNMASRLADDNGPAITPAMRERLRWWGDKSVDRSHPGVVVHELDGHWSVYAIEPGPFGLVVRRNLGVKLAMAVANFRRRAPIVNIKWSLIRAKNKPAQELPATQAADAAQQGGV